MAIILRLQHAAVNSLVTPGTKVVTNSVGRPDGLEHSTVQWVKVIVLNSLPVSRVVGA